MGTTDAVQFRAIFATGVRCLPKSTVETQIGVILVLLFLSQTVSCIYREDTVVITGSKHIARVGSIHAPPSFPRGAYHMDRMTYIFILENVALYGSVQLETDIFDLHPNSWLTVRKSKYSGYLGPVTGRYNFTNPLPRVVVTDTCCIRLEFHTGCCGPAVAGVTGRREFTGFRANYKFVPTLFRGRREECSSDSGRELQLCNGECLPAIFKCPCSKYGQFRCGNLMCVPRDIVCDGIDDCGDYSDENHCRVVHPRETIPPLLGMYALKPILIALGTIVAVSATLVICLCLLDQRTRGICADILENTARQSTYPYSPELRTRRDHVTNSSRSLLASTNNHSKTNNVRIQNVG